MKTLFSLASFCILAWMGLILMNSGNFSVDKLKQRILPKEAKAVSNDTTGRVDVKIDPSIGQNTDDQKDTSVLTFDEPSVEPPDVSSDLTQKFIKNVNTSIEKIKTVTKPAQEKIETFLAENSTQTDPVDDPEDVNDVFIEDIPNQEIDVTDYETEEEWISKSQVSGGRAQRALFEMNSILGRN